MFTDKWSVTFDENHAIQAPMGSTVKPEAITTNVSSGDATRNLKQLVENQASSIAKAPLSSLGPQCLMTWLMGGNSMFGVMMVGMALVACLNTLMKVTTAFSGVEANAKANNVSLIQHKLTYVMICIAATAWIGRTCAKMGMVPSCVADFIPFIPSPEVQDFAVIA